MESKGERELLAIVFTDAVGSSSQTALDEDKSLSMLMADLDSIRNEAAARGGSVLKNTGDGLLISFKSAVDAIECALSIQKAFQGRPKGQGFQHKIGVHIGDVIKKDGDIYGAGVNTASRLVDQCAPGGICLSSTLYELTKQKSEIGRLKLQNFMLQNTEPPTLAYKSIGIGEPCGSLTKKTDKKIKPIAWLAITVACAALVATAFYPSIRENNFTAPQHLGEDKGFEFVRKPILPPKSKRGGARMRFTLENQTERRLELRWIDFDGKEKMSDDRKTELSELAPNGEKFVGEKTFAGHVFQLRDVISRETMGYLFFVCGKRLEMVISEREGDGQLMVEPKGMAEAIQGQAVAQANLAEAYASGDGLPQNLRLALYWATKSSQQNCPEGMRILARIYENGEGGVMKDPAAATVLREQAEGVSNK